MSEDGGVRLHELRLEDLARPLPGSASDLVDAELLGAAAATFDRLGLPDGLPFVLDDDGGSAGCADLNRYLVAAVGQRALSVRTARSSSIYHLTRLLRFLRSRHPSVDGSNGTAALRDAVTADLVNYKDHRRETIGARSWNTELASLAAFFTWAAGAGLVDRSPMPRWGARQRNTLAERAELRTLPRYLTEPQLRDFLTFGLLGEGSEPGGYPERDHVFGLLLSATGLRREEAAFLLDCELPSPDRIPEDGVTEFVRYGKGGRPRRIYVTSELAHAVDLYRSTTRRHLVEQAQPGLRRARREGRLLLVDEILIDARGRTVLVVEGSRQRPETLSNAARAEAVSIAPDGSIEPLGLFLTRRGLPANVRSWNRIFVDAEARLRSCGSGHIPPSYVDITPHAMRHTFAVRMLAALMRLGRERAANPYHLLASPLVTLQQLMGHVSPETTMRYLVAAEKYDDALPQALRELVASAAGASL